MIQFIFLIIIVSLYEIYYLVKNKYIKELVIFVCMVLILACFGLIFMSEPPLDFSFSGSALKFFGM